MMRCFITLGFVLILALQQGCISTTSLATIEAFHDLQNQKEVREDIVRTNVHDPTYVKFSFKQLQREQFPLSFQLQEHAQCPVETKNKVYRKGLGSAFKDNGPYFTVILEPIILSVIALEETDLEILHCSNGCSRNFTDEGIRTYSMVTSSLAVGALLFKQLAYRSSVTRYRYKLENCDGVPKKDRNVKSLLSLQLYMLKSEDRKCMKTIARNYKNLQNTLRKQASKDCQIRNYRERNRCFGKALKRRRAEHEKKYWNQQKNCLSVHKVEIEEQGKQQISATAADLGMLILKAKTELITPENLKLEAQIEALNGDVPYQTVKQLEGQKEWGTRLTREESKRFSTWLQETRGKGIVYGDGLTTLIPIDQNKALSWVCSGLQTEAGQLEFRGAWPLVKQSRLLNQLSPYCAETAKSELLDFCTRTKTFAAACANKGCTLQKSDVSLFMKQCGKDVNWQRSLRQSILEMLSPSRTHSTSRRGDVVLKGIREAHRFARNWKDVAGESWFREVLYLINEKDAAYAAQKIQHYLSKDDPFRASYTYGEKRHLMGTKTKEKIHAQIKAASTMKVAKLLRSGELTEAKSLVVNSKLDEKWQQLTLARIERKREELMIREYKACFSSCQSQTKRMGYSPKRRRYICTSRCENIMRKFDRSDD